MVIINHLLSHWVNAHILTTMCMCLRFVQEIYQDRKKFSEQVFKVASSDLVNMGIGVVSYTLKDVHDDQVWYVLKLMTKHNKHWKGVEVCSYCEPPCFMWTPLVSDILCYSKALKWLVLILEIN